MPLFFFQPFFFLCLIIFFFLLFFFFFSSHKATWSRRMVAAAHFDLFQQLFRPKSACFGGRFSRNQTYRHVSVAVLAISIPVSAQIGPFWPKSTRIWPSRHKTKKKKKRRVSESDARRRIGLWYNDLGAASVLSRSSRNISWIIGSLSLHWTSQFSNIYNSSMLTCNINETGRTKPCPF